jgi:hypothetical protein
MVLALAACGGDDDGGDNGNGGDGDSAESVVRTFFDSINDKDPSKAFNALSKDCVQGFTEDSRWA